MSLNFRKKKNRPSIPFGNSNNNNNNNSNEQDKKNTRRASTDNTPNHHHTQKSRLSGRPPKPKKSKGTSFFASNAEEEVSLPPMLQRRASRNPDDSSSSSSSSSPIKNKTKNNQNNNNKTNNNTQNKNTSIDDLDLSSTKTSSKSSSRNSFEGRRMSSPSTETTPAENSPLSRRKSTSDLTNDAPTAEDVRQRLDKVMDQYVFSEEKRHKIQSQPLMQQWKLVQLMEKAKDKEQTPSNDGNKEASKHYADLLQHRPESRQLSSLAVYLKTKPIFWVSNFVNCHGVKHLCELLEQAVGGLGGIDQLSVQEGCLDCMRALLHTRHGTSALLECPQSVPAIVRSLDSFHLRIRTEALMLMSLILTLGTDEGKQTVNDEIETYGLERLGQTFISEEHVEYRTAVLVLFNSLMCLSPQAHRKIRYALDNLNIGLVLEDVIRDPRINSSKLKLQIRIMKSELLLLSSSSSSSFNFTTINQYNKNNNHRNSDSSIKESENETWKTEMELENENENENETTIEKHRHFENNQDSFEELTLIRGQEGNRSVSLLGDVQGDWDWGSQVVQSAAVFPVDSQEISMLFTHESKQLPTEPGTLLSRSRQSEIEFALESIRDRGERLRDAVLKLDSSRLSEDEHERLIAVLPTEDEVSRYQAYDGAIEQLSAADQFLFYLKDIPSVQERITIWYRLRTMKRSLLTIETDAKYIDAALRQINDSDAMTQVLAVVLSVTNIIREMNGKIKQKGLSLRTLLSLESIKTNDQTETLLEYIVSLVETKLPQYASFYNRLTEITEATENIDHSIPQLHSRVEKIKEQMTQARNFNHFVRKEKQQKQQKQKQKENQEEKEKEEDPFRHFIESTLTECSSTLENVDVTFSSLNESAHDAEARFGDQEPADIVLDCIGRFLLAYRRAAARIEFRKNGQDTMLPQIETRLLNGTEFWKRRKARSYDWRQDPILPSAESTAVEGGESEMSDTQYSMSEIDDPQSMLSDDGGPLMNPSLDSYQFGDATLVQSLDEQSPSALTSTTDSNFNNNNSNNNNNNNNNNHAVDILSSVNNRSGSISYGAMARKQSTTLLDSMTRSNSISPTNEGGVTVSVLARKLGIKGLKDDQERKVFKCGSLRRAKKRDGKWVLVETDAYLLSDLLILHATPKPPKIIHLNGISALPYTNSEFSSHAFCLKDHEENRKVFIADSEYSKNDWVHSLRKLTEPAFFDVAENEKISIELQVLVNRDVGQLYDNEFSPWEHQTLVNHVKKFDERESSSNIEEFNGEVRYATLHKLVVRLTSPKTDDNAFLFAFMLTYKSFTTPSDLLELLCARFDTPAPHDAELCKHFISTMLIPTRLRVCQILKYWLDNHFYDFRDDRDLQKQTMNFIKHIRLVGFIEAAQVLQRTLKTKVHSRDTLKKEKSSSMGKDLSHLQHQIHLNDSAKLAKPVLPSMGGTIRGRKFTSLEDVPVVKWSSREIARQMTLIENEIFAKIQPKECLNQAWNKEHAAQWAPNLTAMIKRTNQVIYWIATEIISKRSVKERVHAIRKFIKTADECVKINNFNAVMQIVGGLHSSPVTRLRRTWAAVPDAYKQKFKECEHLVNQGKNFRNMRKVLKRETPPCVPYVGMFLTDLTFIEDGNRNTVNGLINFFKRRKLAVVIKNILRFQKRYSFISVPELQSQLREAQYKTEEELYNLSLEIEPRKRK